MNQLESPSSSLTGNTIWDGNWAESSLSKNPSLDQQFYTDNCDDTSSELTTSTMQMSEYQRTAQDTVKETKMPVSILKKK